MRWRDRFVFCAEATYKSQAETGEIKGHYLNATAGDSPQILLWLIIAATMAYFFTFTVQCMQLLIDRKIMDWVSMPGVIPVASGGIHVWHMPALTEIFGDYGTLVLPQVAMEYHLNLTLHIGGHRSRASG
uniref:Ribulose bisphosphate carboxylase large subunit C-terminal domain-containing protein n=1 Tax=Aegilops tauschii subsp. strangulata TaxID=200361 RepID=A0A453QEN2_AEGTS